MTNTGLSFRVHCLNLQPSEELVREAFQRAARRLSARAQYAAYQPPSRLSSDARRLHPLHGFAPEECQLGADDE